VLCFVSADSKRVMGAFSELRILKDLVTDAGSEKQKRQQAAGTMLARTYYTRRVTVCQAESGSGTVKDFV